ncbi:hypothetical protein GN956_G2743 [Arapaima gigas]
MWLHALLKLKGFKCCYHIPSFKGIATRVKLHSKLKDIPGDKGHLPGGKRYQCEVEEYCLIEAHSEENRAADR